jgi:hypothetical protein
MLHDAADMNGVARIWSKSRMKSRSHQSPGALLARLIQLCALGTGVFCLTNNIASAATLFSLYKSTNQGASWFKAGQGLPPDTRINALSLVGEVAVAGTDRGIYISRDAGMNWQPAQKGIAMETRVLCLATLTGRVFAGTHKHGVLVSDDVGTTWKAMNSGLTDSYVRSLLAAGTKLYAGTDSQGVFISERKGASWTNQRGGLPDSSQIFDLAAVNGTVFAGLYSKGLFRWEADLQTWVKSGTVVPLEIAAAGNSLVVGHNPGGIYVSGDRGMTWLDGNSGLPINAPTWTLAADAERVWLGTSGKIELGPDDIGLFVSKDQGKSWIRSDAGLPPSSAAISFMVTEQFILAAVSSKQPK